MPEGKNVNLRVMEKQDLPQYAEWINKPEFLGEYNSLLQMSKSEAEKIFENPNEMKHFVIEKKDGSKIGLIFHFYVLHPAGRQLEIGYCLVPSERGKGYCTEAVKIMVDYLFLSRDTMRVQACTDTRNLASQKVLEKAGFKREGVSRKDFFTRGRWTDDCLYSILREEWKEPKTLAKSTRQNMEGAPMSSEIDAKIRKAMEALRQFGHYSVDVSAKEFYDYMTGEIFSEDPTTLQDVLNNEYIMIHELVEISELKKIGRKIDKSVIMETPKIPFYTAHFNAMETELEYALYKRDTYWAKIRLRQHKGSVLDDDPNLPEELRPRAEKIYKKYRRLAKNMSDQPITL